jgi:very-short-patch-repair endonuclease
VSRGKRLINPLRDKNKRNAQNSVATSACKSVLFAVDLLRPLESSNDMSQRVNIDVLQGRQAELRNAPTAAEIKFRARLEQDRIPHAFQEIIAPYIVDFVFPHKMLVVELDGEHHRKDPKTVRYDARRTRYLERLGLDVWRIPNEEVLNFELDKILRHESVGLFADAVTCANKRYDHPLTNPPIRKKRSVSTTCCAVCSKKLMLTKRGTIQRHRTKGGDWCKGSPTPISHTAQCTVCKEACKPRPSGKCGRCRKVLSLVKNNSETLSMLLQYVKALK